MSKSPNKGKKGSSGAGSANNKKQNSGNANVKKAKNAGCIVTGKQIGRAHV